MQKQIKVSADGESARSQAFEAQENRQSPPPSSGASSDPSPKGSGSAEDSTSATENLIQPDSEAQDILAAFIRKGEDDATKYIDIIEEMMSDYDGFHWAESTLINIYDFIGEHGYITTKQMEAVDNIRNSKSYGNRHK